MTEASLGANQARLGWGLVVCTTPLRSSVTAECSVYRILFVTLSCGLTFQFPNHYHLGGLLLLLSSGRVAAGTF